MIYYIPNRLIKHSPTTGFPLPVKQNIMPGTWRTRGISFAVANRDELEQMLYYLGISNPRWIVRGRHTVLYRADHQVESIPKQMLPDVLLEQYSTLRRNASRVRTKALDSNLTDAHKQANELMKQLTEIYERIYDITKAAELKKDSAAVAAEELESLQRLPDIDYLAVKGNLLMIQTHPLTAGQYLIGRYTITISIAGVRFISAKNEHPLKSGYAITHHTNIHGQGDQVCWGNIKGVIAEFQARRDVVGLVGTIIEFLKFDGTAANGNYRVLERLDKNLKAREAKANGSTGKTASVKKTRSVPTARRGRDQRVRGRR